MIGGKRIFLKLLFLMSLGLLRFNLTEANNL